MKYYIMVIPFLLILSDMRLHAYSNAIFSKNTTIAHPETGLFLDYVGLYTPSETIIHTSTIFPMTTATYHFLPLAAAENIPSCNVTHTKTKRPKRLIGDVISIGMASASLAMSASNSIQIANLQQQAALVEHSLSKFSQTLQLHGAQLAKITLKQIELTEELQMTQKALNAMIPVLDAHSEAINTLKTGLEQLHVRLQHSFLYLAMTQIFRNEFTLDFLAPEDVHKVVYTIIKQGNLTFNSHYGSLPIVQIITNLLVRQQIDFIPRSQYITMDSEEIGRLVITSYFAVPRQDQMPFYTYKLLTIPFFHDNETIEIAGIPRYWAINPANNTTMEWHNSAESGCNLQLMITCRDTPPIRTISNDTCFDQIIGRLPLSRCQTIQVPTSKYFVRPLRDNFYITSSPASVHCLKIPQSEYPSMMQHTWSMFEEIILPPVALVNVTSGYTVACPGFTLVGRPVISNTSSLVILYNSGVLAKNISVMNVHEHIIANMTWFKRNMVEQERKDLKDIIDKSNATSHVHIPFSGHMWPYGMSIFSWVLLGLSAGLVYYVFRRKRRMI